MADFFEEPKAENPTEQSQTFNIGGKQYTQEQLDQLVSLGETAQEAQSRYNTDLTKVYPEYIKTTQRVKELEEKQSAWERQQQDQRFAQGQLTPDEIRERALEEANNIGLVTQKNVNQYVQDEIGGQRLADELYGLVEEMGEFGIQGDKEEIRAYMEENGIGDPLIAADELYGFREKLWEAQRQGLDELNEGEEFETFQEGQPLTRVPEGTKITDDNFVNLTAEILNG